MDLKVELDRLDLLVKEDRLDLTARADWTEQVDQTHQVDLLDEVNKAQKVKQLHQVDLFNRTNQLDQVDQLENPEMDSSTRKSFCNDLIKRIFKEYFFIVPKPAPPPDIPEGTPRLKKFVLRNWRLVGMLIPCIFFHFVWWSVCIRHNHFVEFVKRYRLSVITIFGATSGGITSIGGGVIAFPVMTLGFTIPPPIARDFCIMCQAVATLSGTFLIFWMRMKLEWHFLVFCTSGAAVGTVIGFELIDPLIPTIPRKLAYGSVWLSCAFAFFLFQRNKSRQKFYDSLPDFGVWQAVVLSVVGVVGGISGAIVGVDFVTFPIRTLLFRVNEKVAVPTSVVYMAINTLMGFYWRNFMSDTGVETESWKFLAVVVPIVAMFGPFGAYIAAYLHGYVKAFLMFALGTVALVSALCLNPVSLEHGIMVGGLIVSCDIFFLCIHLIGEKLNRNFRNEGKKCDVEKSAAVETVPGSNPEPAVTRQNLDDVEQ